VPGPWSVAAWLRRGSDLTGRRELSVHHTAPIHPDPTNPDSLLTLSQVLAELRVPRSTFLRWRQLGQAPRAIRLPGGQLRFRRSDLTAWIAAHTEPVPETYR
jgi:predicted DNA-binding transcriptional regulator AlpA